MGSQGFVLEPVPAVSGRGQGAPWTSLQLITGPSLMAEAAMPTAHQEQCGVVRDTLTCSSAQLSSAQLSSAQRGVGIWTGSACWATAFCSWKISSQDIIVWSESGGRVYRVTLFSWSASEDLSLLIKVSSPKLQRAPLTNFSFSID